MKTKNRLMAKNKQRNSLNKKQIEDFKINWNFSKISSFLMNFK
jgi:hypothetical protein